MDQKLRIRILKKLAQTTQTNPPSTTAPPVGSPPALPAELTATLNVGYNADTVPLITTLANVLNGSLHYASGGKGNYQKIKNNNFDPNDADDISKNLGNVAKQVYSTFLNNGNAHVGQYDPQKITSWVDTVLGSSGFNDLATLKATSPVTTKIQTVAGGGSLKDAIRKQLEQIKIKNPINQ